MSHEYYQQLWKEAQNELKKNITFDARLKKKGPFKSPAAAKWLIGHLFMNYVGIVNKLDKCYDQMIHPQKREVIGRLLDMSLGRLLELKAEIVRIEYDDYCFFDNILIELKLTHQDMEIQVPQYFWRDREKAKAHRRMLIQQALEEAEKEIFRSNYLKDVREDEQEEAWTQYLAQEEQKRLEKEKFEEQQKKMVQPVAKIQDSLEELKKEIKKRQPKDVDRKELAEAIALIQRHERARQGRKLTALAKRNKALKNEPEKEEIPEEIGSPAATVIQRHWRRHKRRLEEAKKKEELSKILGLAEPSFTDREKFMRQMAVARLRRKLQERNQREYEEAMITTKEKVTARYSIPMEEDTVDEIRSWFHWFYEKSNFFPDFPPEKPVVPTGEMMGIPKKLGPSFAEKAFPQKKSKGTASLQTTGLAIALAGISAIGGSALVVGGHWIGPQEFLICQKELEKRKKAGKGEKGSKEKKASKKKLKEQEKRKLMAEEAAGLQLRESNFLAPLNKADRDYRIIWLDMDESKNYEQRYIYEFVKDDKCWELSMEVRKTVDEMMVIELELLKDALERDKFPKKKRKRKKKKKSKKKGKKKKQKKDLTGDRTLDDLFVELYTNGIIKDFEEAFLKDYLGERSFAAFDMRQRNVDWPPSSGDVRELLLQLCILPLGSSRIHQLAPLIKSVCLTGTENSGKEFLARIVCTEAAAVMFDLTPSNLVGKYPGKSGLKMLQHLVEKMSRALQPSIIFVDGAEKTFYKKVPKEERDMEPKRMAKVIQKITKGIKGPDQVLLLGVSSEPWKAKKRKFLKTYQKIILVPLMDYGSYVRLWQALLRPYHSVPRDFDVSCLARVSDGFSVKTIMDAVKNVLSVQRIAQSPFQPFKPSEFLDELLKTKPTDPKMKEKCLKFYEGTDLPKRKKKNLKELLQDKEKAKKG